GRTPPPRTNDWRTEGGGIRHRIRHGRRDATGIRSVAGNQPAAVSRDRQTVAVERLATLLLPAKLDELLHAVAPEQHVGRLARVEGPEFAGGIRRGCG